MSKHDNIQMASTVTWRYTHLLIPDTLFQQPSIRVISLYVVSEKQNLSLCVQKLDFEEVTVQPLPLWLGLHA